MFEELPVGLLPALVRVCVSYVLPVSSMWLRKRATSTPVYDACSAGKECVFKIKVYHMCTSFFYCCMLLLMLFFFGAVFVL